MIFWIIIGVIAIVVFTVLLGKTHENKSDTNCSKTNEAYELSTKELVDQVRTFDDLKQLKTKFRRAEKSFENNLSGSNQRIIKQYETLHEAYHQACNKTLFYQYEPILGLDSTLEEIDKACSIYSIAEYDEARNKIGGEDRDWTPLSGDEYLNKDFETVPKHVSTLREFRLLVDDLNLTFEEKAYKIQELAKIKTFRDEYFFGFKSDAVGQEWLNNKLHEFGVPLIDRLVEMGYTTPEKVTEIDLKKIQDTPGFGPKKLQQLESAIEKIKNYSLKSYDQ